MAPRTRARIAPAWGNGCLSPAVSAPIRARTAHARGGTSSSHRRSRRRGPGRGQRPLGGTAGSRRRSRLRGRWLRSHPRGGTASSRRRSQRRGPGRGNVAGFDAALLRKLQGEDLFLFFGFLVPIACSLLILRTGSADQMRRGMVRCLNFLCLEGGHSTFAWPTADQSLWPPWHAGQIADRSRQPPQHVGRGIRRARTRRPPRIARQGTRRRLGPGKRWSAEPEGMPGTLLDSAPRCEDAIEGRVRASVTVVLRPHSGGRGLRPCGRTTGSPRRPRRRRRGRGSRPHRETGEDCARAGGQPAPVGDLDADDAGQDHAGGWPGPVG